MRTLVSILILLLFVLITKIEAIDALLGKVLSIDHKGGKMVVNIEDKTISHEVSSLKDNTDAMKGTTVYFTPGTLPKYVKEGSIIRLWGDYIGDGSENFRAQYIYHAYDNLGYDPTGVRSRLRKGRKMEKGIQRGKGFGRR
ncbi:MAG: hypothetical protein SWO11_08720 [Thermodesulfobacteriota bacterium]|nr:hypothetical protein [Thermodesulfobacteriota bacterium]